MRVTVLLFAAARDAACASDAQLELGAGARAADALDAACVRFPALCPLRPSLQLAVNERYAQADAPLAEGDVVALIPPISGG